MPFEIKGVSGPTLAANGFPLTYNLWVKTRLPFKEFSQFILLKGSYHSSTESLANHGAIFVFPYSEYEGLLQILFIVPELQARGTYLFAGQLIFHPECPDARVFELPPDTIEIGGPRHY